MFKFISNLIKYRKREFDRVQITDATIKMKHFNRDLLDFEELIRQKGIANIDQVKELDMIMFSAEDVARTLGFESYTDMRRYEMKNGDIL